MKKSRQKSESKLDPAGRLVSTLPVVEAVPYGTKGKAYHLPNFFALALGSGRGELVSLAMRPVKDGTLVLDVEMQCELIRLVGDLISDVSTLEFKVRETASAVSDLMDAHDESKEYRRKYDEIVHDLAKLAMEDGR